MPPFLSVYFDLVRFLAAVAVMLSHLTPMAMGAHAYAWPGHEAVVVFFVLSGFMMSHVVARPGAEVRGYVLDRLARLWSVALPALAMGLVMAVAIGDYASLRHPSQDLHAVPMPIGAAILGTTTSAFFLGEATPALAVSGGVLAPNNAPYWSLNYEAMFYLLFAGWVFLRGWHRVAVVAALAVVAGPLVLLLLPCWLAGVAVHRWQGRVRIGQGSAVVLAVSVLALLVWLWAIDLSALLFQPIRLYVPLYKLRFSNRFAYDWIMALLIAAHFLLVAQVRGGDWLTRWAGPIRAAAGMTLTIYLFHLPLAFLAVGWLGLTGWAAAAFVVLPLGPLAMVTEQRRRGFRRWLERVVPRRS